MPAAKCSCIYTDGACSGNGGPGAYAGYGVYFEGDVLPRISQPLEGPKQTNVRGEWTAVLRAIEAIAAHPEAFTDTVTLCVDYNGIQLTLVGNPARNQRPWLTGFQARAHPVTGEWRTSTGKPVENQDLIKAVLAAEQKLRAVKKSLIWKHVRGHSGVAGNEIADKLAVAGAAEHPLAPKGKK